MPNYIKNRLEIIGTDVQIRKIHEKYSTFFPKTEKLSHDGDIVYEKGEHEYGWLNKETNIFKRRDIENSIGIPDGYKICYDEAWLRFPDFNKIIPRPESLDIKSGSIGDMGCSIIKGDSENEFMHTGEILKRFYAMDINRRIEVMQMGIKYAQNIQEHGYKTWYDWSIKNWGVKWNSVECEKINGNVFMFETAWSNVTKLIGMISVDFSDVEFLYEWADEDTGCNCGTAVIKNGIPEMNIPEKCSKEAYELAFKLRPDYKENYELIDGEYKYKEE